MNRRYIVALDQGTTSSRAVVFTPEGSIVSSAAMEFKQHYPQPGWVEHDPDDILSTQVESLRAAVRKAGISASEIAAVGIIVSILNQVLVRSGREEQATMTSLAALVVVLMIVVQRIAELFDMVKTLFEF